MKTQQLKQEIKNLSRFVGIISAKWITFLLLFPAIFYISPTVIYLMTLLVLLPSILQTSFPQIGNPKKNPVILTQTQKKYHYTEKKHFGEKRANPCILVFLCIWQIVLKSADVPSFWHIYPSVLIIINIISRLLITVLFRSYLHYRFTHLKWLDE